MIGLRQHGRVALASDERIEAVLPALGGDLEGFLRAEAERYGAQLEKYSAMYAEYSGTTPRRALYFPLLQTFVEV